MSRESNRLTTKVMLTKSMTKNIYTRACGREGALPLACRQKNLTLTPASFAMALTTPGTDTRWLGLHQPPSPGGWVRACSLRRQGEPVRTRTRPVGGLKPRQGYTDLPRPLVGPPRASDGLTTPRRDACSVGIGGAPRRVPLSDAQNAAYNGRTHSPWVIPLLAL